LAKPRDGARPAAGIVASLFLFQYTLNMNPAQLARNRYRVIFAKDAQELETKLNDTNFVPTEYEITHLTFNSGRAEYLVILERERDFN
jgi:hypothetical protein